MAQIGSDLTTNLALLKESRGKSRSRQGNIASLLDLLSSGGPETQMTSPLPGLESPVGVGRSKLPVGGAFSPKAKPVAGGSELERFINAIVKQESGGRYNVKGVVIPKTGDRAYGKYQVMGANIPSWTKEALGKSYSPQEYLNNPQIQDAVAKYKLQKYYNQFGAAGAAKAWYAGPGNAKRSSERAQYGGPSINQYARDILAKMGRR